MIDIPFREVLGADLQPGDRLLISASPPPIIRQVRSIIKAKKSEQLLLTMDHQSAGDPPWAVDPTTVLQVVTTL